VGRRIRCRSSSPEDTRAIAAALAAALRPGDVVALSGDLGAGKTCLVQGAASALGVTERVTSPTFVLLREHQGTMPVRHLDVYRLSNLQELTDLGFEELLDPSAVVFIEWGDAIGPLLPDEFLEIQIRGDDEDPRAIDLHAHGAGWNDRLAHIGDSVLEWRARDEGTA
jgi:tRNA threonylcarbamoyladenosine biosynthesis protein TsaE